MNKIGFIDYYLDEWHANQYVKWIHDPSRKEQYEVAYAWGQIDRTGGTTNEEWCKINKVQQAASIEELVNKCDSIIVLSPDNPEMHKSLSAIPLCSGKPTYIDKTFAPDLRTAVEIFERAKKYNTPVYSTSALRYASELSEDNGSGIIEKDLSLVAARGPGHFDNYSVHQLEMIVSTIGIGARRAICVVSGSAPMVVYDYCDGRRSVVHCLPWVDFSLEVQTKQGEGISLPIKSDFWSSFIKDLLLFFDTSKPPVKWEETCEVIAMVEAGLKAIANPDQWISITR